MYKFYKTETGYTDTEFRNDGVLTDPDQDATFYVEVYDAGDNLRGTYTLTSDPAIQAIATGEFKVQGFALSAYNEGVAYARWFSKYGGVEIEPYPYVDYWGHILADPTTGYNLCSLDDLKTHLEITGSEQDTYLGNLILRATAFIERYCHRKLAWREHTEQYSGDGTRSLLLDQTPITKVTRVRDYLSDSADFDYTYADVNEEFGWEEWGKLTLFRDIFHLPSSSYPPRNYHVIYEAGYAPIPQNLRQVAIELAAQKYYLKDKQKAGIASSSFGGQMVTYLKDDLSPAQRDVLDSYAKRIVGAV